MTTGTHRELARVLADAYLEAREIDRITTGREIGLEQAYEIQDEVLGLLARERGDRIVGFKMGLTSKAKMRQMGVHSPIYGVLTDGMRVESGGQLSHGALIHPKVEPEIAFVIGKDLAWPQGGQGLSREEALAACSGACAAMELIDSRFRNFSFTLPDVIADNCSSSGFVTGRPVPITPALDLANLGMVLEIDGAAREFGSSAAIYGDPAASLIELVRLLGLRGRGLSAGQIVLAGAPTQALPLARGQTARVEVQSLGEAVLRLS